MPVTLRHTSARALRREASKDKRTVIRTGPVASRAHAGARVCLAGSDGVHTLVCGRY